MGCRLKCQHASPRTSPARALKALTIVVEEGFLGLNLCCLLLCGANLLVGNIFLPQHMNLVPFPDLHMFGVMGVMGRCHPLLLLLHQHLASLSLTATLRDSACQGSWAILVHQLRRGTIWTLIISGKRKGRCKWCFPSKLLPSILSKLREGPGHF